MVRIRVLVEELPMVEVPRKERPEPALSFAVFRSSLRETSEASWQ